MSATANFTWISPYEPDDARGGWKSMQYHLLRGLEKNWGPASRIAPVDVPEQFLGKWTSRVQKQLRIPRAYNYYSDARLQQFAQLVESKIPTGNSAPVVFFGALPFVKCRPAQPYYIYTDGAFFIHYWEYNKDHSHRNSEIDRICKAEAEFMRNAGGVWCSSQKVADRIAKEYNISKERVYFVGTGPGDVPPPVAPVRYENYLVMIAADFERKGGRLAVEAVAAARKSGVSVGIKFIGAEPPADVRSQSFVEWVGWLDMRQSADRQRFAEVLSKAAAQILLSRSDLTPLAIAEAASYGKATFATTVGGIPEMIRDGETGWLVRPEATAEEIGERMAGLFKEPNQLEKAGQAARSFCAENWSWDAVAKKAVAKGTRAGGQPGRNVDSQ